MKYRILPLLLMFFMIGSLSTNVQAQDEEDESFFTEEEAAPSIRNDDSPKMKSVQNSCSNRDELREEVRLLIRPFKYNLAKTTTITYKRYPQLMRVIIPIYSEQEHRIVFSTKGLPQNVVIHIYDKQSGEKKRKELFTSNPDESINTFELPNDYKEPFLYVEYSVPPTDAEDRSTTRRGCVVMMMGYLFLSTEETESTIDTGN